MKKTGRRSAASIGLPPPDPGSIEAVSRPDAPYDLTDEQTVEWWAIVNRMPADFFGQTQPLLAQYCRHVCAARRIAMLIAATEAAKQLNLDRYGRLLAMQSNESRTLASLSVKMRISPSSTRRQETTHRPDVVDVVPWNYRRD